MGLFDPEGLGAGSRLGVSPVPLVPQEVSRLPLQSPYVQGGGWHLKNLFARQFPNILLLTDFIWILRFFSLSEKCRFFLSYLALPKESRYSYI
ncbi:hypothetical protein ACQCVP_15700 [Rossellomorea vietnamensis]